MDLVCFTPNGKKYHKVAWKAFKNTGTEYAVTACGLMDSVVWDLHVVQNDPRWIKERTLCERCAKIETEEG